jgi:uncharacterized membrane protein
MSVWYFISVFLHIALASFWIGGMLFLPLVILPEIKQHPDRIAILYKTGLKFKAISQILSPKHPHRHGYRYPNPQH